MFLYNKREIKMSSQNQLYSFQVPSNLNTEISSYGARLRIGRVGLAEHLTTGLYHVQSFPNHSDYRAGSHVFNKSGEEGAGREIGVVFREKFFSRLSRKEKIIANAVLKY